ncbi:MAG TPA: AbrB/MazE/SpoVT family DNA-binding domain-containing protein [Geminicoccaceae bacterium]|nr:AbrB/MazE/SpoVT family DNA-binding domain-containing protein [Geminicoccaceae bacterium]
MQVARWGNSLAVRLPKKLVEELGLRAGDQLDIVAAAPRRIEVAKDDRRERALAAICARRWALPPDYRFDREEANAR